MQGCHPESIHRRVLRIISDSFEANRYWRPCEEAEQYERLEEVADPTVHPAVVLKALSPNNHPRSVPQLRSCLVEVDGVVVGDLVEEAEERDLVRAEPRRRVPGADVLDGDGCGRERRQHQPLPEVAAARDTPVLGLPHLDAVLLSSHGWGCRAAAEEARRG